METFPAVNLDCNAVPKEWLHEQPRKFYTVVAKLNETTDRIVETYDILVKSATRKLGILPPLE